MAAAVRRADNVVLMLQTAFLIRVYSHSIRVRRSYMQVRQRSGARTGPPMSRKGWRDGWGSVAPVEATSEALVQNVVDKGDASLSNARDNEDTLRTDTVFVVLWVEHVILQGRFGRLRLAGSRGGSGRSSVGGFLVGCQTRDTCTRTLAQWFDGCAAAPSDITAVRSSRNQLATSEGLASSAVCILSSSPTKADIWLTCHVLGKILFSRVWVAQQETTHSVVLFFFPPPDTFHYFLWIFRRLRSTLTNAIFLHTAHSRRSNNRTTIYSQQQQQTGPTAVAAARSRGGGAAAGTASYERASLLSPV